MYNSKEQDHQKRRDQEGSYSLYNYLYQYLLSNYEPENLGSSYACEATENLLLKEGIAYNSKGGNQMSNEKVRQTARQAITNFCNNNGKHGNTSKQFGKGQSNSVKTIASALEDLRW